MHLRLTISACVSSLLLLSGCSLDLGSSLGLDSGGSGASGSGAAASALVVGDEPYAVQAGANILGEGGSAADAATAMYFALSVTYPVAAGLGGGGICLVRSGGGQVEEFDFLARDSSGGGAYAVPGNVRGFALLQSIYGVLPWQRDVAPGEGFAAAGFPISHALAVRIAAAKDVIRLDAGLAAEFLDETGAPKPAGATASNPDLAGTLAALRTGGANALYRGPVGARIIAYSQSQGGAIGVPELARYGVTRGAPQTMQIGNQYVYLPSRNVGAGAFAGALFDILNRALQTPAGENDVQAAIVVAVKDSLKQFNITALPADLGATGFAATDASGQAVACAVTMNGPFGSGHNAADTGVTLARAPSSGDAGLSAAFLTPVIATDGSALSLAAAGAGGPNGTSAVGYALARLSHGDGLFRRGDLKSTGVAPNETINAVACQGGVCVALPDPGANGLGAAGAVAK